MVKWLGYIRARERKMRYTDDINKLRGLFSAQAKARAAASLYLMSMAAEAGIDAPLENLRKFADLIRADALAESLAKVV